MIKVITHAAPDTDATSSAIVYAWYLTEKQGKPAQAFINGNTNKEVDFVLQKFGFDKPEQLETLTADDNIVITDTNNPGELPEEVTEANLLEIVDHHKLGGLSTPGPVSITIMPLASCCSVIWKIMTQNGHTDLPKDIAGLMLASILSDTLKFTSPTTTDYDKETAQKLAEISGMDIDQLADEMFAAKSDLTGFSAQDILLTDSKIFDLHGKKVRISVLETTLPDNALALKEELEQGSNELKQSESLDYLFFAVVDIIKTQATIMVTTEEEKQVATQAFDTEFQDGLQILPGVVSRKKQIAPQIDAAIGKLN